MDFTERDQLLDYRRGEGQKFRCNANILEKNKTWLAVICGVCVVSILSVFLLTSTSSGGSQVGHESLGQSAPNAEESESESENVSTTTERSQFFNFNFGGRGSSAPTVRTTLGRLKGVTLQSRGGREYFGFYNVPYAEPPVGELRFKPPVPAKSWSGTRDATVKGTMCVQKSRYNPDVDVEGTEDCLHVNVFTPKIPRVWSRSSYPVITYFFGGGFMHGTANDFNVDYFMDEDVVLIIVESRVGALGFLNTGDLTATGNQGLKDQVQALKWVQDNIADFGGDPKKILAFGTSSGAMCAHAHLLSPMSNGLMSGVMSFSGTMLLPGGNSFDVNPKAKAVEMGQALNCTDVENSEALITCLRNASPDDIALNQPDFTPSLETVPEDGDLSNVFFSDTPVNLIMSENANKVPWLVGVNSAEAILQSYTLLLNDGSVLELNNNFDTVVGNLLELKQEKVDDALVNDILHEIREFYFGNKTVSKEASTRFNLTNLMSDRYYIHPTKLSGMTHAKQNPVYWYYLTKEANVSFADSVTQYFEPPYGVSHADEVQYVFSRPRYPYIPLDSEYAEFSKMFVKLIVSFADSGAPVNPLKNGVEWPKVDPNGNGTVWFNLGDEPKLIEPFTERMQLWDSFPFDILYNNSNTDNANLMMFAAENDDNYEEF